MRIKPCPYCGNTPISYERDVYPRYMMRCDSGGKDCAKMRVRSNSIINLDYKWDNKVLRIRSKIDKKI